MTEILDQSDFFPAHAYKFTAFWYPVGIEAAEAKCGVVKCVPQTSTMSKTRQNLWLKIWGRKLKP